MAEYKKILFSAYRVWIPSSTKIRRGFLVKVDFKEYGLGYADLMSWPEIGDLEIDEEARCIRRGNPSRLGQQVIANAQMDAFFRSQGKSAWDEVGEIPESHLFVGDRRGLASLPKKYSGTVKVKWTPDLKPETLLSYPARWRIDFNEKGELETLLNFFKDSRLRKQVDFIEDPFLYKKKLDWIKLRNEYPDLKIFGDFALEKNPSLLETCQGAIIKPASRNYTHLSQQLKDREICVTQSLGHPLGVMTACYHAAKLKSKSCGSIPVPNLLEDNLAEWNGIERPQGLGIGYSNQELEDLKWQTL